MENGVTLDRRIPNAKIMPFQLNYGVRADDVNRTYRNTIRKCKYLAAPKRLKRYTYIYQIYFLRHTMFHTMYKIMQKIMHDIYPVNRFCSNWNTYNDRRFASGPWKLNVLPDKRQPNGYATAVIHPRGILFTEETRTLSSEPGRFVESRCIRKCILKEQTHISVPSFNNMPYNLRIASYEAARIKL